MKKTMRFLNMTALLVMGAVMAACTKEEDLGLQEEVAAEKEEEVVTLTASTSIVSEPETRALVVDGNNLAKTFAVNDCIAVVYTNTSGTTVKAQSAALTYANITNSGKSANFTVTLTNPDRTKDVKFIYPAVMANDDGSVNYAALSAQDGTLDSIASDLDYCEYAGSWNAGALPTGTMTNKLAYLAVTLKNASGTSEITSAVTSMTVSDGSHTYVVTRSAAAGPIYVAIQPTASADIEITAVDNGYHYSKSLTGKTYASGQCYNLGWRMERDLVATPLTVEALTAGTVKVVIDGTLSTGMKYAVNGGAKTLITTSTDIPVSAGDRVQFYGNGTDTQVYGVSSKVKIQGSGDTGFRCKAYGNIMSLLDETGFAMKTDLPNESSVFASLFGDNTALTDAGDLLLPATTLAQRCYSSMFYGCTALTAAPALPATTLAQYCYSSMFRGCTALTTAPDLLVTTLVTGCYNYMFSGCTNLTSVKCLATMVNNSNHTNQWLHNVAATGTVHIASGLVWSQGANGIPSGWTGRYPDGTIMSNPFPMADATSGDVGKVIGADGKVYISVASATNAGTTAVAVLVYVGSDTDNATYTHGLAIAMSNDGRQLPADAVSTFAGKTAVSGGQWQLPSLAQWKTMIKACSGDDLIHYALNTLITNAGGATLYVDEVSYYWTSTNTSPYIYSVKIPNDYQADYVRHNVNDKLLVRACLAF